MTYDQLFIDGILATYR